MSEETIFLGHFETSKTQWVNNSKIFTTGEIIHIRFNNYKLDKRLCNP